MGTGTDVSQWPIVQPVQVIPPWWNVSGQPYGLAYFRNTLWVSPRVFYAQGDDIALPLTIFGRDGQQIALPIPRQIFSGFVKRGPGLDPYVGGGGYESGQGTASGPSLADLNGNEIIRYRWPWYPGENLEFWNQRAPREPNYTVGGEQNDTWVGWEPRVVNGVLEGRWASDRIYGGGLLLGGVVTYWPWMATGTDPLSYSYQTYTFAPNDGYNRTYEYSYTPQGAFLGYAARPEFDWRPVVGQELGPDGRIYLAQSYQWASGFYEADVAIKVFG
jgi:hypothetical protein